MKEITLACEAFQKLLEEQLERIRNMNGEKTDFATKKQVTIGVIDGDGIGPVITAQATRVLEKLLAKEIAAGSIVIKQIEGLTIENRMACGKAIPDDVLAEIKDLRRAAERPHHHPHGRQDGERQRGHAPGAGSVRQRAVPCVSPKRTSTGCSSGRIPRASTFWAAGAWSCPAWLVDFKVTTDLGTRRIARAAFDYAKNNGKTHVAVVTKANIMKKTDGKFTAICHEVAADYPGITVDDYYIDIMTANLLKEPLREQFQVVLLPNLYGDIITDEAAQIQGGVGTAGSANVGDRYAMFEAIHGSAPRMIERGMGDYANPASIIKAAAMLLCHICRADAAARLEKAMAECKVEVKSDGTAATAAQYADAVMALL